MRRNFALKYATRVIGIRAGEIVFDGPASEATQEVLDKIYNGKVDRDGNIQEEG